MAEQETLYMRARELAKRWGVAETTLAQWRARDMGPKFIKVGSMVLYEKASILAIEGGEKC